MLVTFVGQGMRQQATAMHRYFLHDEDQVQELLRSHGWSADHVLRLDAIAQRYRRACNIPEDFAYFMATAERCDGAQAPAS